MQTKFLAVTTALALTLFMTGCKPGTEEARPTAADQAERMKQATKETAQEVKDYAFTQKSEFVAKMQTQLDDINRDLDQLSAKIDRAKDSAKTEAQPKLEALRQQAAKLRKRLDEAKESNESTWNDIKAGLQNGYTELKDGFQQARQWASDKIAP